MLVHQESGSLLLKVRQPELVKAVISKHREINYEGHNLAVRFGLDEVRVLNNMGIKAPSPILYDYNWPGRFTALDHQQHTASMLTIHKRAFVLNETGTMKTASSLWAADYLMKHGLVNRVLIVAKLSTLERVWLEEIFNVLMHRSATILHGTLERRLERLAQSHHFYIINHEGLELVLSQIRARSDIDLIIYDEASELRNPGTNKWKALNSLVNPRQNGQRVRSHHRLWLMTATPCPNAPTDAWALAKLVNPLNVPDHFNTFKRMTMLQVSQYKWVPKKESATIAYGAMQPAVRYRKADCLQLPPLVTEERAVPLSKEQVKLYNQMRVQMVIEMGTPGAGDAITAANAADKLNKLRQILCGAVKHADEGHYTAIDHKPRFKVLVECIQEANAKVIVVVPFKGILQTLENELWLYRGTQGNDPRYSAAVLNGDVSPTRRNEIITAFKHMEEPNVLLCHPAVMAHGLNLTEADMTIFYAPIFSNDQAMQVIERFNRPGQMRKMTVIRMGAQAIPLEWEIYKQLDGKQDMQEGILDLYHRTLAVAAS